MIALEPFLDDLHGALHAALRQAVGSGVVGRDVTKGEIQERFDLLEKFVVEFGTVVGGADCERTEVSYDEKEFFGDRVGRFVGQSP